MSVAIATLTYGGNAEWRFVRGNDTEDPWDWDVSTRVYEGRPDRLEAFKRQWPKGKAIEPSSPWMVRTELSVDGAGGPWPSVTLTFKGVKGMDVTRTKHSGGRTLQRVEVKAGGNSRRVSLEYYAPSTTFRYIDTKGPPFSPRHVGEMIPTTLDYQVVNRFGATGDVRIVGAAPTGPVRTSESDFRVYPRVITTQLSFDQVGSIWQIEETNEGRLEDLQQGRIYHV